VSKRCSVELAKRVRNERKRMGETTENTAAAWSGELSKTRPRKSLKAGLATVVLALNFILLLVPNGEIVMAQDRSGIRVQLAHLQAATDIVMMAIPYGVAFSVRVDEEMLPKVSCIYQSGSRSVLNTIVTILEEEIIEYGDDNNANVEIRIGILFKQNNNIVDAFYFEDWAGNYDVKGVSRSANILAKAALSKRFRALLAHPDVVLIRDRSAACPPV
jgi:hypothetical protein